MKNLPMPTDTAPASMRSTLKNFNQNLDGQFAAEKTTPDKRIGVFTAIRNWCTELKVLGANAKIPAIATNSVPVSVRPLVVNFHQEWIAPYGKLDAKGKGEAIATLSEWCAANQKVLSETETAAAGKGAGAA
jgi:hypothetical protein